MTNFLWVAVLLWLGPTTVGSREEILANAQREYSAALETELRDDRLEGFRRAERLFERVIGDGVANAALYTNLGNARLQSERLGPAILAYRRALLLDPDHAQARKNLDHARSLLPAWVPRPEAGTLLDTFFFWHRTLSHDEKSTLAACSFALALVLLAAAIRWRLAWVRNVALLPFLAWIALVASLVAEWRSSEQSEAVVTQNELVARSADSPRAPRRFEEDLPGGAEVQILETREGWARIRLANGRDAWVPKGGVTQIREAK